MPASITAAKRYKKEKKKERCKKNENPYDVGHFLVQKLAFLSRSELIWPISRLKISKMSQNMFLLKSFRSKWVKTTFALHRISVWIDSGHVLGNNIQETDHISFQWNQIKTIHFQIANIRFSVPTINDESSKGF